MSIMLYPIVRQLEEHPARGRKAAAVCMLASVVYTALDGMLLEIGNLPWKLDAAGKMLGFALGGWFFLKRCGSLPLRSRAVRIGALALMVFGGAAGMLWNDRIKYLGSFYGNTAVFYLSFVSSVLGACLLLAGADGCRPAAYVGRRTLAVLLKS